MMRTVAVVVPDQVHLLDLAGPAQVFTTATDAGARYRVAYVAATAVVASHQGLALAVGTDWPALTARDLVLVPGRRVGSRLPGRWLDPAVRDRVAAHHHAGGRVASVCSGAFALAEAGLLDGRSATTHHELQDRFARRFPRVRLVRDVLFVDDAGVATSAGIASGIDLALHIVAADHGPALAARVARSMVVPVRRNGAAPQASVALRHRDHLADVVHRAQDLLDAGFADPWPLTELAHAVGVSERTLTRLFTATTGRTPLRYQQELRVEHADRLAAQGWTAEASARAVGFTDARMLRRLRHARPGARPGQAARVRS